MWRRRAAHLYEARYAARPPPARRAAPPARSLSSLLTQREAIGSKSKAHPSLLGELLLLPRKEAVSSTPIGTARPRGVAFFRPGRSQGCHGDVCGRRSPRRGCGLSSRQAVPVGARPSGKAQWSVGVRASVLAMSPASGCPAGRAGGGAARLRVRSVAGGCGGAPPSGYAVSGRRRERRPRRCYRRQRRDGVRDRRVRSGTTSSSHNTYLDGHQVGVDATDVQASDHAGLPLRRVDCWTAAPPPTPSPPSLTGGRCARCLPWMSPKPSVMCTRRCRRSSARLLSLEMHCKLEGQQRLAQTFIDTFGEMLERPPRRPGSPPG